MVAASLGAMHQRSHPTSQRGRNKEGVETVLLGSIESLKLTATEPRYLLAGLRAGNVIISFVELPVRGSQKLNGARDDDPTY